VPVIPVDYYAFNKVDKIIERMPPLQKVELTSWGDGCGWTESPGDYTKVSQYHQWIRRKI
jgi:hypothetical protein